MYRKTLIAAAAAAIVAPQAQAVEVNDNLSIYGSLRQGIESVSPDGDVDNYVGLRDAYSRIGFAASGEVSEGLTGSAKYELGIDSTTGEIGTLAFDGAGQYGNKQSRVAKIGLSGDFGSVHAGKMWGLFYNAIAYPVDMYSSYYAGWSTYALFRTSDTLAYSSPTMGGFQFDAGVSFQKGPEKDGATYGKYGISPGCSLDYGDDGNPGGSGGDADAVDCSGTPRGGGNVYTFTGSWSGGPMTISLGYEVRGSDDSDDEGALGGGAVSLDLGNLDLAGQFESVMDGSENNTSGVQYFEEDASVYNIYAGYTAGDFLYKAKFGEAEGVTGTFTHLGVDYNIAPSMKFFAEYYQDEGGGFSPLAFDQGNAEGGSAITAGAHYSF